MIPAIIIGAVIEGILLVIGILIYINVLSTRKELKGFIRSSEPVRAISPAGLDIYTLPRPVTEYLKKALHEKPGKFKITALKQSGNIKVAGKDSFQPFRAEQYIRLDRPGFIWLASVKFLRFFWVSVRDIYTAGRSEIFVRFISAFRLSRVEGNMIAASSLIRYLLEMVWSPFLKGSYFLEGQGCI